MNKTITQLIAKRFGFSFRIHQVLAIILTIVALAVGQQAQAQRTVTYTVSGNTEQGTASLTLTATGSDTGYVSNSWSVASTTSRTIDIPGDITLTIGTDQTMAVQDGVLQIGANSSDGGYITLSNDQGESNFIYHIVMKDGGDNTIVDAWNMAQTYTYSFQQAAVKTITVTYNSKLLMSDAEISGIDAEYIVSNVAVTPVPTVTWHGTTLTEGTDYTLSYTDNTAAGTAKVTATGKGNFSTGYTKSQTYTLRWATYTVRFNKNNDSASGTMSDMAFYYTEEKALTANAFTAPTGYHFDRWTTNADGTGNSYTDGKSVSNLTTNDGTTVDLYAQWTPKTYTVTLDNQSATTPGTASVTATYDDAMPDITVPTRTGYTFGGYYTAANGGGTKYYNADGTSANNWNIASATTLYAYWTANTYTVTLDNEGATTAGTASVTATYDAAMPTIIVPARTGYTFGGYYTEVNGGGTKYYNADGSSANNWNIASATTLYAKWTANTYTLRLHYNDGTNNYTDMTMTYDVATNIQDVSRTGYTLAGWSTTADGAIDYTDGQSVINLTTTNGTTIDLYAQWTANTYTVTLDNQNATTAGSTSVTATFDATMPAITIPTKTGFIFGGYYTEVNGGGTKYYNTNGTSTNNWNIASATTLYARWYGIDDDWNTVFAGTKDDPYIISSSYQFNLLAQRVNSGTDYSGKYFKLGDNITITQTIGTSQYYSFKGTFDGNGKTLTLNLTNTDGSKAFIAPFSHIKGATIKRLHTVGTITTSGQMAGGIVGDSWGTSTIQSCRSSVTISASVNGDGTHGGLVGRVNDGTLTITDCLFDGSITGTNTHSCGGFVGWKEASLELNRCLQAGNLMGISSSGGSTFCRYNSSFVDFSTCYYKTAYGTAQGTQTSATGSDLQALLGDAWEVSGGDVVPIVDVKNLGIATISGVNSYYDYTGNEIMPEPTVTAADGTVLTKGTDYTETFTPAIVQEPGDYTLTITGTGDESSGYYGSQTINFSVYQSLSGYGTPTDPYVIGSADDWESFVNRTAISSLAGEYFRLDADISVSEMASTNESYSFSGNFDGNGHKITLTLNSSVPYTGNNEQDQGLALFRFAGNGCTIHDLTVDGTITTVNKFAAGFISYITNGTATNNKNIVLRNCRSSVGIISTVSGDATTAGFVAMSKPYVNLSLENCLFDGSFQSSSATQFAGFVGWQDINGKTTIKNSLVAPASIALTANSGNHRTFCRYSTNNNFSLTNSYYRTVIGTAQGAQGYSITADVPAHITLTGETGVQFSSTCYAATGETVSLTLADPTVAPTGYTTSGSYSASSGSLSGSGTSYTLAMPSEDVFISCFTFGNEAVLNLAGTGYGTYYNGQFDATLPAGMKARIVTPAVSVLGGSAAEGSSEGTLVYETIADGDTDTKTIPAGTAVMLYSKGEDKTLTLSETDIDTRDFSGRNLLHGSDTDTETTGGAPYYKLTYGSQEGHESIFGWYWGAEDGAAFTCPAHKAWLALGTPTSGDARAFIALPDEDTEGIKSLTPDPSPKGEGSIYTLNGVKLDKQPTRKGVYIHNGRKVVIK